MMPLLLMRFLEIGQILVALAGLAISWKLTRHSIRLHSELVEEGIANGRRLTADMFRTSDIFSLLMHVLLLAMAAVSLRVQCEIGQHWFENGTWPIPFMRMALNVMLTTKQLLLARYRTQLLGEW